MCWRTICCGRGEVVPRSDRVSTITFLYVILSVLDLAVAYVDYERYVSLSLIIIQL